MLSGKDLIRTGFKYYFASQCQYCLKMSLQGHPRICDPSNCDPVNAIENFYACLCDPEMLNMLFENLSWVAKEMNENDPSPNAVDD